jgi:gliding motility-associated-like protein
MGIAAHFEGYAGSGGSDSLYLSFGSNSVQASPLSPNSIQYAWDPLSLLQEAQTICAYLFTADGCVDSICQNIAFFPTVTVPNFFTPNNDLRNDELIIESINAEVLEQRIFNRWGQLVFETTRPDEFWDGRINDNLASPGVYFLEVRASNSYTQDQPVVQRTAIHLMD